MTAKKKKAKTLTVRERGNAARVSAFIEEYLSNGQKGGPAARAVGYSAKTADSQASRLLRNVKIRAVLERRLAEIQQQAEKATGLTVTGVLTELRALVHSDLRRAFHPKSGELLPPHLWPDDLARAMCSIKVVEKEVTTSRGQKRTVKMVPMYVKEVKLWDKGSSIERAMKHLGMFKEDNKQRGDAAIRALMEAVSERSDGFEVRS